MLGAFGTLFIACWIYQAGARSQSPHTIKWMIFVTALFFMIQLSWNIIDAFFIYSDNRPILEPMLAGFIVAALIRTKLVMRKKITLSNLFSHLNIFSSKEKSDSAKF